MRPTTWVCAACGREGASKEDLRNKDSSCGTWATEVYVDTIIRGEQGHVVSAQCVDSEEERLAR